MAPRIYWDVTQGEPEWYRLRLGVPTSSDFDKIVTPAKCELSAQSRKYAFRLLAEKLLNVTLMAIDSLEWVERGKLLEPQAARAYEFQNDVETKPVGFVTTADGRMGCSPDRLLIGVPGGLEIKCPAPQTQIAYWFDGFQEDYKTQVQGQMLIAELEFVDKFAYHPQLPPVKVTVKRDEPYITKLAAALDKFCDEKDEMERKLRASGFFEEASDVMDPWESYLERLAEKGRYMDAG